MSTTYTSKKPFWNKKKAVIGGVIATFLIPAAAWAAINIYGFGDINADAQGTQNLTVDNVALTGTLVPGRTVGSKAIVHNPNDFAVTVTHVILKNSSLNTNPATPACQSSVHPVGSTVEYPKEGSADPIAAGGTQQSLTESVVVPANGAMWVNIANAVSQDGDATVQCGVKAHFAVVGQNSN